MRKQVLVIVSIALASFLVGTMFSTNYLASGAGPPSVWDAINELQAKVNSLNSTVIEQQAQITELQIQLDILNATKLGTPDYDSGWTAIQEGHHITFTHGLGTTEVTVYVVGRYHGIDPELIGIHQIGYGMDGLFWSRLTESTVEVYRNLNDGRWSEVRVLIWKIPQP